MSFSFLAALCRPAPATTGGDAALVTAPLSTTRRPASTTSCLDAEKQDDQYADEQSPQYEYDISSLALGSVPFPFTVGFSMDSPAARRFSSSAEERVGLLGAAATAKAQHYGIVADAGEAERLIGDGTIEEVVVQTTAGREARLLAKYSLPLMVTYLLQYSFSLVTLFVVGHIGTDELGAVSLATMTANITGLAVYEGLATSLDTLCAQAYGSGKKEMVGLHLQRMILFMLIVTLPIGAIWLSSGWILAALVPEKALAHLAGRYLSILLAGAPGYAIFEAGKRFTQAQGLFNASLFVLLIATPINVLLNYLFVFVLKWDLEGAALATVLSHNLLPVLLWVYVYFINPRSLECWAGFTRDAFRHWGPMAKLAVPGIIMVETEWLVRLPSNNLFLKKVSY
jgi:MATE family multidrug resistance protein